jgi:Ca2+-binding RTX toxin-like protein
MAYIPGTDGYDWLRGTSKADTIYGFGGVDFIFPGGGADYINGGAGRDRVFYDDSPVGVYVNLATGLGSNGTAEGDRYVDIEDAVGSHHNDTLVGDDGSNSLYGGYGDDLLQGGGGADSLAGGRDNDTLKGGGGDDHLSGDEGNDTLRGMEGDDNIGGSFGDDYIVGGPGRDTLGGGDGGDIFVWTSTSDTGVTAATADLIYDFSFAAGDRLVLSFIDADVYAAGNQSFTFIGTAPFSGTPGEVRYYHADYDTYIELQTGTSADVEGVIRLSGIHTPQASWFVL